MSRIDEFRQAKNSFILYILYFSTLWFLAVCILFGLYIYRSFEGGNVMATQTQGDYSQQGVAAGTAQSVAATNQVFHDLVGYVGDKYAELDRDVLGVSAAIQQSIANENQCCCNTLRAIDSVKYENAQNTNKILEAMAQNKIEALQSRINSLELAQATSGVVRYPASTTYTAGMSPFCNGCGCGV